MAGCGEVSKSLLHYHPCRALMAFLSLVAFSVVSMAMSRKSGVWDCIVVVTDGGGGSCATISDGEEESG